MMGVLLKKACFQSSRDRRATKYSSLITDLFLFLTVKSSLSVCMSTIGTMGSSFNFLLSLLNDLHLNRTIFKKVIMKAMDISIRCSYSIFCYRSKAWTNPELLAIYFIHALYLFTFTVFEFTFCMLATRKQIICLASLYLVRCIIVICIFMIMIIIIMYI